MAAETELPLLPTMGIGSYAAPGWFIAARRMIRDGKFGECDVEELFDDATRITVADQIEAGIDIFPSIRMNSHYKNGEARGDPSSPTYGRFRREHPELLIGCPGEVFPVDSVMFGIRTGLDFTLSNSSL